MRFQNVNRCSHTVASPSNINALHLTGMEDDLKTIFEHPMFEDIVNVNPIPFTLSSSATSCDAQQLGHKACFKQAAYNFTMSEEGPGMYDAACIFWLDPRWNPEHGIPINVAILDCCVNVLGE